MSRGFWVFVGVGFLLAEVSCADTMAVVSERHGAPSSNELAMCYVATFSETQCLNCAKT